MRRFTQSFFACSLCLIFSFLSNSITAQVIDTDSTSLEKEVLIIQYPYLPSDLKINDLLVAKGNNVWAATDKGVYHMYSTSSNVFLENSYTNAITEGKTGEIWAAGNSALYNVNEETTHPLPIAGTIINDLTYQGGKVWLATDKGILTYSVSGDRFKEYNDRNSKLKSNQVNFIQVDDEDVIWAGTANGYLRIKDDNWESEDKGYDVIISRYNNEGQWMVATDDMWLINKFNRKFPVGLDSGLYRGTVNDFEIDSKGRLYMASDVLVRYDPATGKTELYDAEIGLLAKRTLSLACDYNNNIWIGTEDSGLFRIVFADIAAEQLTANIEIKNNILCADGSKASLNVNVVGGTKPYKYSWSDGNLSGKIPNGVAPGQYTVTVTDKNGAESISSIDIIVPDPIVISLIENQRIGSAGAKDGIIEINVTGGTGEISLSWDNGKTGPRITRLEEGQHIVTARDANGCEVKQGFTVKPEKSFPTIDASQLTVGQTLRINNLYFLADSSDITADSYEVMDEVYDFLKANKNVVIEIGGHTNTIPSNEYCDALSSKRAKNVADYLYEKGIRENRVTYKGYGKRQPITEDRSLAGRRLNQRVEVKILGIE